MAGGRTNTGMVVSGTAHAAVLVFAAVSFAAKPFDAPPTESMPVDIVSISEFSQMMAGSKAAPKQETPKPLVEKKAEPRPAENQTAPVEEKPEIVTASAPAEAPPPPPVMKAPDPKPAQREPPPVPPRPPEKQEATKKEPDKKLEDAEALKPEKQEKKQPKKLALTAPLPPKRPEPKKPETKPLAERPPQQEKSRFNADQIQALLDKRQPRRLAAAGETLSATPALGTARGAAPQLSQNEIDALRARIQQCWNPPAGQTDAKELTVLVRIQFNQDGSLAGEPRLLSRVSAGYQQVAAESALRAIRRCAPYDFMPAAKYDAWKDIEVNFDPRDLYRG